MKTDCPCDLDTYVRIMRNSSSLIAKDPVLACDVKFQWDIDAISSDFVRWLSIRSNAPRYASRVEILSSFRLVQLLTDTLPGSLVRSFRLFVEVSSVLYSTDYKYHHNGIRISDLVLIRSFTGARVLHDLDKMLQESLLVKGGLLKLKALFVLLFGTILAVGYSGQLSGPSSVSHILYWLRSKC